MTDNQIDGGMIFYWVILALGLIVSVGSLIVSVVQYYC